MRAVPITDFKAHCLQLIEEVRQTGQGLVITKRGKPAARVLPPELPLKPKFVPGMFSDMGKIVDDIVSPLDVEWEALN
jgi:prevent-host-death family protein